ncbi:uncharacterized protein LOC131675821 [Topomyia yanbarensis]|uniref:uncharacterized protein LOC131675821 n=1 Tax=Topomyia yanbarensis TaxID=2498891 RepID=UPI00273C3026|nr:uncharacterized protein LOC131675821 [Topomyia yanbarensis]
MANNNSSCAVCNRPDWAEKLVQCDNCDHWYHFTCAGVTDSIQHRDWTCTSCLPLVVSSESGTVSSRCSAIAALELQRLEEEQEIKRKRFLQEKALEKRRILEQEAADRKKLEEEENMERTFLQEKYELKKVQIDTKSDGGSIVSRGSRGRNSVERVVQWIQNDAKDALNSTANNGKAPYRNDAQKLVAQLRYTVPNSPRKNSMSGSQQSESTHHASTPEPPSPFMYAPSGSSERSISRQHGARIREVLPPVLSEYKQEGNTLSHEQAGGEMYAGNLSPTQIAARRVMSRGLPEFSGNPEDWPVFLSQFNITTECCGFSHAENLVRLQHCLKGMALDSVRSRLLLPSSVPQVMETLKMLYGRPALLINSLIQRVRNTPAPKIEKLHTVVEFGMELQSLCDHLIAANQEAHLTNPSLLQELEEKLPAHLKLQWAVHKQPLHTVTLKTFADFMSHLVSAASQVTSLTDCKADHRRSERDPKSKQQNSGFLHAHSEADEEMVTSSQADSPARKCLVCEEVNHRVKDCELFNSMDVEERWRKVNSHRLCRTCLNQHGRRRCRITIQCGIDGCQFKHHRLLHSKPENATTSESLTHRDLAPKALFRIIPVTVHGKMGSVNTFAFLDDGSSLTLVERSLAEQLGENGPSRGLILKWTGNVTRCESGSQEVSFGISGQNTGNQFQVKRARTVSELNLPIQSLNLNELMEQYPHLKGLPIHDYKSAQPRILLGLDQLKLSLPLKYREGRDGDPVAAKTRLCWCIYGGSYENTTVGVTYHILDAPEESLHDMVKQYFGQEDAGVKLSLALEPTDEKRARQILEHTTKRVNGQYETGLLWRYDHFELPDSYHMALRRLECLERRMQRDPLLKDNLHRQIKEYQSKGYAHRASASELSRADPRRIWYLPLGAVINPRKPEKIRLIWDAAASVCGISLNSVLLKGPDQLCSLPGALFRFRQRPIAVSGDIREMFHQIRIRSEDCQSQRFLWRDDPNRKPDIFLMDVATFGATCSPCSAQYVKNRNAKEFADKWPRAAEAIIEGHYVDDYLDSFDSIDEAKLITTEVTMIHQKGGFEIRNWLSNAPEVLNHLKSPSKTVVKNLDLDKGDNKERVLGMLWLTEADSLGFSTQMREDIAKIIAEEQRPTKRQVLKCVMSLFDPLGILALFSVHGKILIQRIWRSGISWDDEIEDGEYELWRKWIGFLPSLVDIQIPRCYMMNFNPSAELSTQLHIFVDASEEACSSVAYLRFVLPENTISCAIVSAKTKVAPLKPLSIPRLELQAAILGARLARFIEENHNIKIDEKIFWSDSRIVLAWIRSDSRRYS